MINRDNSDTVEINGITLNKEERQECEIWTRVMGYYRPISNYNTGKLGEFHERAEFKEPSFVE